jgi:hypothetical protein
MDKKSPQSPDLFVGEEKGDVEYAGVVPVENGVAPVSEQERKILRKIDNRLVPLLAFLYLVAFVDRSNSTWPLLALMPIIFARTLVLSISLKFGLIPHCLR